MRKLLALCASLAVAVAIVVMPAGAIVNGGVPDDGAHPMVGELLFHVPDAVDPRFTAPGAWFTCSGTLLSATVLLTAGHCADGVGLNGVATTPTGGDGGNDVWVNFEDEPDFSILPPSAGFIPNNNAGRYAAWSAALNASDEWTRGTAQAHPSFDPAAFFLFDAGIIVLSEGIELDEYGTTADVGTLDTKAAKKELYTPVGYGLNASGPKTAEGGDIRFRATVKLVNATACSGSPTGSQRSSREQRPAPRGRHVLRRLRRSDLPPGDARDRRGDVVGVNLNCSGTSGHTAWTSRTTRRSSGASWTEPSDRV